MRIFFFHHQASEVVQLVLEKRDAVIRGTLSRGELIQQVRGDAFCFSGGVFVILSPKLIRLVTS